MTPRVEAYAYRIWCAAQSLNWDCSIAEAARVAGVDKRMAHHTVAAKDWGNRFLKHKKPEREVPDVVDMMR